MRKYIIIVRDWTEEKLRYLCGRISPTRRNLVVIVALALFSIMALYVFGSAIYQIGKHEGAKMTVEHIKQLNLKSNGEQGKTE